MNKCFLKDIAQIDISSVDKKVKENEISIKLCNFTDVYNNWAITERMYNNFMNATANRSEIERYKLKKGMIAITKDSEKKEDIGMSSYIADSFDDVILGYHTALINPYSKNVDSKYLNAYLNSYIARKYFSKSASGSGQRYTLTIDIIKKLPLYLPSLDIQKKIGNLLSNIDRKIEINYQINNNLEELMKTIYQRWFIQFEFPNEEGKPYKSNGGKLAYNEELKSKIPENWKVVNINEISDFITGYAFTSDTYCNDGRYKLYTIKNVQDGNIVSNVDNTIEKLPFNLPYECILKPKDLIMSLTGNVGRVGLVYENQVLLNQRLLKIKQKNNLSYLYSLFRNDYIKNKCERISTGTSQKNLSPVELGKVKVAYSIKIVDKFEEKCSALIETFINNLEENQRLKLLKEFILPLLMNGQINVDDIEI